MPQRSNTLSSSQHVGLLSRPSLVIGKFFFFFPPQQLISQNLARRSMANVYFCHVALLKKHSLELCSLPFLRLRELADMQLELVFLNPGREAPAPASFNSL